MLYKHILTKSDYPAISESYTTLVCLVPLQFRVILILYLLLTSGPPGKLDPSSFTFFLLGELKAIIV
jgi:hypothetical protein